MTHQPLEGRLDPPSLSVEYPPWGLRLVDDELVNICWRGVRLLSGIRVVVRDEDWRTVPTRVGSVNIVNSDSDVELRAAIDASGFGIEYSIDLRVAITTEALEVAFTGMSRVPFRSNRIGLVVLHPGEAQGSPVVVEHTDGSIDASVFPTSISPHQPFLDIAALKWAIEGVEARLDFEGDVFETEDQRNWTDASFKTYSRPLERPFPFDVEERETVTQSVCITARGDASVSPVTRRLESVVIGEPRGRRIPEITTTFGAGGSGAVFTDVLLAEVDLTRPDWRKDLDRAVEVSRAHPAQLDLRLVIDEQDDVDAVAQLLGEVSLVRLAMFNKSSHMTEARDFEMMSALRDRIGQPMDLLAGTRAHFTELNRSHERLANLIDAADGVTFSITPQMHASEVRHIVASLEAQKDVARSAAAIARGKPLHIGPITMESRFNAVATTDAGGRDLQARDPLMGTSFAAAWALGSVVALAADTVASLSYFHLDELIGTVTRGLLETLGAVSGAAIAEVASESPIALAVLPVEAAGGLDVFVANLTANRRRVEGKCAAGFIHPTHLGEWVLDRFHCPHVD